MKKHILTIISVITYTACIAQPDAATTQKIKDLQDKVDNMENKIVNLGISIGYKHIWKKDLDDYQEATISPIDTTLKIQSLDNGGVVLSTELMINPFIKFTEFKRIIGEFNAARTAKDLSFLKVVEGIAINGLQKLTFIASVNLAEFQAAQNEVAFNKKIDGGLGLGLRLADNFWIAWTYEVTTHRQLRGYIQELENQKIVIGGSTLTELDPNDNDLFYDKRLSSSNFKFILKF